jgi:hypothetical protein
MFMWMIGIPGPDAKIVNAAVKFADRGLRLLMPDVCRPMPFRGCMNGT